MTVTATELKAHLGKYLEMVRDEDIQITKKGIIVAQLSSPQCNKLVAMRSLVGIADNGTDISLDEIRDERLNS